MRMTETVHPRFLGQPDGLSPLGESCPDGHHADARGALARPDSRTLFRSFEELPIGPNSLVDDTHRPREHGQDAAALGCASFIGLAPPHVEHPTVTELRCMRVGAE